MRDNHAYTLSGDFELFWTLVKLDKTKALKVALFSSFLEIKFKSRFRYPFKRHTKKGAQWSFIFNQFLGIKI